MQMIFLLFSNVYHRLPCSIPWGTTIHTKGASAITTSCFY